MIAGALTLAGVPVSRVRLCTPGVGVPLADVDMADEGALPSGRVTMQLGDTAVTCTVDATHSGDHAGMRRVRLLIGAGGWGKLVPARGYAHNDAGIKGRTVATDVAAEVGETLAEWAGADRLGSDYARTAGLASAVIADVARGAPWWVALDGSTHVGPRPARTPAPDTYDVIDFDPRTRVATLALDDVGLIGVGDTLTARLASPLVVTALDYVVTPEGARAYAWCSPSGSATELGDALAAIVAHVAGRQLFGRYRYRVVNMLGNRVQLQATRKLAGVPDEPSVEMWPGVAGVHATLTPGSEVHVEFEAGDRTLPMIVDFGGRDRPAQAPVHLDLGGATGAPAARQGDAIEVPLPPAVFSGTIGGVPATGVLTFPIVKTLGIITAGSGKVGIAT